MSQITKFFSRFGPGILFASTCIGVSHLVQSTRAGALYGFELMAVVLLANLFKYPFFEYGTRYAAATGQSILVGYHKEARWMLILYLLISIGTMFTVTAGVTIVAAGLLGNILQFELSIAQLSAIVLLLCFAVLYKGDYLLLERIIKVIASLLVISTLIAFLLALVNVQAPRFTPFNAGLFSNSKDFIFIIALMGWMPSALDLASWNSIWTVEKMKSNPAISTRDHIKDFNVGYLVTAILAFCFLTMGALLLYDKGVNLSDNSIAFADQLIGMYTSTLGDWVFVIIAISAFSTMFSTTLTVLDGYPRVIEETIGLLVGHKIPLYRVSMGIIMIVGWGIIVYFSSNLSTLIDLATAISFVVAPIIALINFRVVVGNQVKKIDQPPGWLRVLSYGGLIFLFCFTIIYLVT